ncbi:transmembrane protein 70 homolog, mitochondrial [Contarinia nasturtii]|uniref:transmembrane protein 70 homolog, mitochondrial n=1 Tax=Contarinia nasturtii TaxID=265458 RepID=UPI0012D49629|nr:transmembrane protein 70 homolog, mitochondrial [Contarinia nasturtii]
MIFTRNLNKLLLCNKSNVLTSSRNILWYNPAPTNIAGSNIQVSALRQFAIPQLAIERNGLRFMSTIKSNENIDSQKPKHFTDDSNPDAVSIYQGKYTRQIIRVKMFSLATSVMGLFAQPVLWHRGVEASGTGLGLLLCSVVGIFTFVTPLLLHFVTKKYVVDVKYNVKTDEYTCVTVSFFLFRNEITFKVEDIHLPEVETMFTSMKIGPKKVPVFVDAASFNDTHHYARFMGYDKPLDIRMNTNETEADPNVSSDQTKTPNK